MHLQYEIISDHTSVTEAHCLIVGVFESSQLSMIGEKLNAQSHGYLDKILAYGDMTGKIGQSLLLYQVSNINAERVLLIGCGKASELKECGFRKIMTHVIAAIKAMKIDQAICSLVDLPIKDRDIGWKVREIIQAFDNQFHPLKSLKTKEKQPPAHLKKLVIPAHTQSDQAAALRGLQEGQAIAAGMNYTKDLGNLPANIATPSYLAEQAQGLAKHYASIRTKILEMADMKKLGMGALLSVAQGSHQPAKLIVLEYHGAKNKKDKPIALVGKGVTFDSGGISLKAGAGMDEMKFDMCGAASVMGTIKVAAELKLAINLVGVIPATENMPGGSASKPGDVITTLSGQTIEILNTDAEGRLILADALTYSTQFNPALIIDIATLTGAIITTLGDIASGLFSNHEALAHDLITAGQQVGDRAWAFPLWEEFQEKINTNMADMANLGSDAKSITAACLLARFVQDTPWAHLDIAGVAWKSGKEKQATGRPVALLSQYLLDYANGKTMYSHSA